jgi:N-acetylneuraminic acid mutarotase
VVPSASTVLASTVLASTVLASAGAPTASGQRVAAGAALTGAARNEPTGSAPVRRACPPPKSPDEAACQALVRTDAAGHQGRLAAGVVPDGYGPADLQNAYNLPSATGGRGATVAIVDAYDDPTAAADLAVYRHQYGLPPCTIKNGCFRKVNQYGGTAYPVRDVGWAVEISLDLDTVSAICPNCHILLVEADSDYFASLGAAENEAVALGARYVSDSWAGCFIGQDRRYDHDFDHPGVAVTAASGDYGYDNYQLGNCAEPSYPSASPDVVAVGGTTLTRDPSSPRGWSESAWSDTGSGCTVGMPKPAWQKDSGCAFRTQNDVSAVADPNTGVAVYDSYQADGWTEVGGTSVATPLIAATYALAGTPVGGTFPASYAYAHRSALNDVTSGSNSPTGCAPHNYLCTAGKGYDGPTGLGTPEGVAAFQAGLHGAVTGTVTSNGKPVAGAQVSIGGAATVTGATGRFATTALAGTYPASAGKYGYTTERVRAVTITSGGTTQRSFTLRQLATATVTGTVTDASGHGWPLYAQIHVPGTPVVAYTSPVTGRYRLALPVTGKPYRLDTSALYPGYQASSITITPAAARTRQNIGLAADLTACDAPGYQLRYSGYTQDFSTGKAPAGWRTTGHLWAFNDPDHLPNYTGGSGGFVLADGLASPRAGGNLYSPVLNLSRDRSPVLQYDQDLQVGGADAEVSVSTNGGKTWTIVSPGYASAWGPDTQVIPLPQAAGRSKVQIEYDTYLGTSWEVDNFFVGERSCQPMRGGLVVGQVRDRNTGQPVNGAVVADGAQRVTTMPEPGDPAVGGGLYWLATTATGRQRLTASAGGYRPATAGVTVAAGAVTRADFSLAAGRIAMAPARIAVSAPMGGHATARLTITNTGSAPVTLHLNAQQGVSTPAEPSQPTAAAAAPAAAPARQVRGHFTPQLGVARRAGSQAGASPAASPAALPWQGIRHLPDALYDNAAATDPATGAVYSVGGVISPGFAVPTGFVYHPATRAWSQLPNMRYGLDAPVAAVIGGELYVTGGYDQARNVEQPALEVYDPATGTWTSRAPIPHPGYGATATVLDGKMYVIGGCVADGVCTSRDVQVYDPAVNRWTQAAPYPLEISFEACGGISGTLYCAGGFDHNLGYGTSAAYAYHPASNTWRPVAGMPIDLWGAAHAAANGQLLVSGGVTRYDSELTSQGFSYNPAANTWTALPPAPHLQYRSGSACGFYQIGGVDALGQIDATAERLPGYGECDGGTGVPWLSASPAQATLAPGQSTTVTLTLNAAGPSITQPGRYTATIRANSNTPYLSPQTSLTLTVRPPK